MITRIQRILADYQRFTTLHHHFITYPLIHRLQDSKLKPILYLSYIYRMGSAKPWL